MSLFLRCLLVAGLAMPPVTALAAAPADPPAAKPLPSIPLSLDEVQAWIDRTHPLLKGAGTEKVAARAKMLKALGAFEPMLINDTEVERFISSTNPAAGTQSKGFNDTVIEARHPWGFRGSAGIRDVIGGPARIPDLGFNNDRNQVILGGFFPLLKA